MKQICVILGAVLYLLACNSSEKKQTAHDSIDSHKKTDTTERLISKTERVNALVKGLSDNMWHVVTDAESGWTADAIATFVTPQRAKDPDYPYVASGDFNCDGKPDYAALVTDSLHKSTSIVFITDNDAKLTVWAIDAQGAAISSIPPSEVNGFVEEKEKKVKLRCNGLNAEWYEKASYVIYWDGKKYDRVWTAD